METEAIISTLKAMLKDGRDIQDIVYTAQVARDTIEAAIERLQELEALSKKWCELSEEDKKTRENHRTKIAELQNKLDEVSSSKARWVSVKDHNPTESGNYITYLLEEGVVLYDSWYNVVSESWNYSGVTHWLCLPELPKPPVPTFKDKFLEAFPKAYLLSTGYPNTYACDVFSYLRLDDHCSASEECDKCWDLPYFEEEGEG